METVAETASTNADLKARVLNGDGQAGLWLRAEKQSGGVGRLGRKWESPKGNLYCSTMIEIAPDDPPPHTLSFVVSLAVHEMLKSQLMGDTPILLKWPNDVLVENAKICGILLERVGNFIVVGIGVNVVFAPNIGERATISIQDVNDQNANDAAAVLGFLVEPMENWLQQWRSKGLAHILEQWTKRAHPVGSIVTTSTADGSKLSGQFSGLKDDGALCLRKPDGALIEIHAGDIEIG
ncbi:biotin--[acetyl-CoA-carboxylase] ligase [Parasphingorhabdus sp.]|uniref:biotin--[acetyl-CoA-carboxylase] ligase n=1 Tax=Parasphingorhabdus sp. TaxID=2709688 RepID=UPI0032630925